MSSRTLFVRHLPDELTKEEKEELLKHLGATAVKGFSDKGPLANAAFATYNSEASAEKALKQLHQLDILGNRLIVQYAKQDDCRHFPHLGEQLQRPHNTTKEELPLSKRSVDRKLEEFYHTLHGLSDAFKLLYPIRPTLHYRYPPATPAIISNITHALSMVPKFYTQVLHLMNKMNLPPPFDGKTSVPMANTRPQNQFMKEMASRIKDKPVLLEHGAQSDMYSSSTESEISSDEATPKKVQEMVTLKRPGADSGRRRLKRPKLQDLVGTKVQTKSADKEGGIMEPAEIFEQFENQTSRKIEFKLASASLDKDEVKPELDVSEANVGTGFGQFAPAAKPGDSDSKTQADEEASGKSRCISKKELRNNRLSKEEMKQMAIYKKYDAGEPISRLYLKNLAKQVEEKDLRFIYSLYIDQHSEDEKNMFDVRLMKEGRMKGQAFINLPSEKKAEEAVKDTNGYILFGKPLVVQFARSAKPKDAVVK